MCSAFILNKINKAPEDNKEKSSDQIQYNKIQFCTPLNSSVQDMMREDGRSLLWIPSGCLWDGQFMHKQLWISSDLYTGPGHPESPVGSRSVPRVQRNSAHRALVGSPKATSAPRLAAQPLSQGRARFLPWFFQEKTLFHRFCNKYHLHF